VPEFISADSYTPIYLTDIPEAVQRLKPRPPLQKGKTVKVRITIPIKFALN
jgi:hypothetical protein